MAVARLIHRLDALTDAWFGYARPPAMQAINRSMWMPDRPGDYCTRCGDSIGPGEQTAKGCGSCRGRGPVADEVVRLGPYVDELRLWVINTKFGGWLHMGDALGRLLGTSIKQAGDRDLERAIIVPSPMPTLRRVYRGVDHARLIAAGVAAECRAPIVPMLGRRNGPPQVSLSRGERQRQGGRGLFVRTRFREASLEGCDVILVDDVRTTGATMRAMRHAVEPFGPRQVIAAVAAVSDDRARRPRSEV